MLSQYELLLVRQLPSIKQWQQSMFRIVNQHWIIIHYAFDQSPLNIKLIIDQRNWTIIDVALKFISMPSFYEQINDSISTPSANLLNTIVTLLINLMHEPSIVDYVKQKHTIDALLHLRTVSCQTLSTKALVLLSYLTSEDDIKTMDNSDQLLTKVINSSYIER
jgi:hypothetical protein